MAVSFEDAMSALMAMFPDWDRETLEAVLASNEYHLERTVENVLAMDGGGGGGGKKDAQMEEDERLARELSGVPADAPSRREPPAATQQTRFRGTHTVLPEGFLMAPGWRDRSNILADEQLALMLQNEMFREEARAALGNDFMRNGQSNRGPSAAQQPADLGIMKTISEMGTGMKSRLNALAADFSRRANSGYVTAPQEERKPLIGRDGKEADDEEEEEISFSDQHRPDRKKNA